MPYRAHIYRGLRPLWEIEDARSRAAAVGIPIPTPPAQPPEPPKEPAIAAALCEGCRLHFPAHKMEGGRCLTCRSQGR